MYIDMIFLCVSVWRVDTHVYMNPHGYVCMSVIMYGGIYNYVYMYVQAYKHMREYMGISVCLDTVCVSFRVY